MRIIVFVVIVVIAGAAAAALEVFPGMAVGVAVVGLILAIRPAAQAIADEIRNSKRESRNGNPFRVVIHQRRASG